MCIKNLVRLEHSSIGYVIGWWNYHYTIVCFHKGVSTYILLAKDIFVQPSHTTPILWPSFVRPYAKVNNCYV